jgi:hypothetical protein
MEPDYGSNHVVPFLCRNVESYKALVVTEEKPEHWFDAPPNVRVKFFSGNVIRRADEWSNYVEQLGILARDQSADLLVIDSFSRACAADENSSRGMTRAFAALRATAEARDLSILVLHHLNHGGRIRGSGAIKAQADHVLTLNLITDEIDPRRTITSVGRSSPPERIEYTKHGDGTLVLSGPADSAKTAGSLRKPPASPKHAPRSRNDAPTSRNPMNPEAWN